MNEWKGIKITSAAQGLQECNQCGECCRRAPCAFADARDVKRVAAYLGKTVREFLSFIRINTWRGQYAVEMQHPCPLFVDNRCSVFEVQPEGAREFRCWDQKPPKRFLWTANQLRKIGYVVGTHASSHG